MVLSSGPSPLGHIRQEGSSKEAEGRATPSPKSGTVFVPISSAAHQPETNAVVDDDDADAYDFHEARPRSVSLSSQLQYLRELTRSNQTQPARKTVRRNHLLNRVLPVELPRPAKMKALLDVYFRDMDSYFPFLERGDTELRIHQTLAKLGYAEDQSTIDVDFRSHSTVALLCNMLAVAQCFSMPETRSDDLRPGWSIFVRGCKLIQYCSSPKYVDLDLIRYHALGAEYLMQSELLHAASQAISNAIQVSMFDRLNIESVWDNVTEKDVHRRKMLWWIIYFLDRKIAQRMGGPYIIRDTEVAVSEFYDLPSMPFETTLTCNYMQALVNLAKLWSQAWDSFFAATAPKPCDWKEIEVMDTRIMVARKELPPELTWETDLLGRVYLAQGEQEPQIRRRLGLFLVSYLCSLPFCWLQPLIYST